MEEKDKEQFINDVNLLMELAFDGAMISTFEEELLERIRKGLEKI